MKKTISRYSKFIGKRGFEYVPFIPIIKQNTDYYVMYDGENERLDQLSFNYYGDPNYGWLILQANPEYGSLEFLIPNGSILRIPYPFENAISKYNDSIEKHKQIYGNK